jgi:putative transposase
MARLARLFLQGCAQHIIQYAAPNTTLFHESRDYEFFLVILQEISDELSIKIHAYTLLKDHLHILLSAPSSEATSKLMQSLGRRYVQFYNRKYHRTGTLWRGRYRATSIENERFFLSCSRYIDLNAVRTGLVEHPAHYPWSSYNGNTGTNTDLLLTHHEEYSRLGNTEYTRHSAYKEYVAQGLTKDEFKAITTTTKKGWVLASEQFIESHEHLANRRMTQAKRGRPRKNIESENLVNLPA